MVDSLRLLPAKLSRKWGVSERVAAGLLRMSSSSSFLVVSSAIGGSATSLCGGKGLSSLGECGVRLERREANAPKRRAAWDLEVARCCRA
jgi:hypothetical protein